MTILHYPDHFLLGISDLGKGIEQFEEQTGVRPAVGGVHPEIGTCNALVSLGESSYLEIIAPDPGSDPDHIDPVWKERFGNLLTKMDGLTPFQWVIGSTDIETTRELMADEDVKLGPIDPGFRKRPDGTHLGWRASFITGTPAWGLPFFIQWDDPAVAPPTDSPRGCNLAEFSLAGPNTTTLKAITGRLGLDTIVNEADRPKIRLTLDTPRGKVEF